MKRLYLLLGVALLYSAGFFFMYRSAVTDILWAIRDGILHLAYVETGLGFGSAIGAAVVFSVFWTWVIVRRGQSRHHVLEAESARRHAERALDAYVEWATAEINRLNELVLPRAAEKARGHERASL